jgi:hypothetical protein
MFLSILLNCTVQFGWPVINGFRSRYQILFPNHFFVSENSNLGRSKSFLVWNIQEKFSERRCIQHDDISIIGQQQQRGYYASFQISKYS